MDQVNRAVTRMAEVTRQVAANAEEAVSASEEPASQAQRLNSIVLDPGTVAGGAGANGDAPAGGGRPALAPPRAKAAKAIAASPGAGSSGEEKTPRDDSENEFKDFQTGESTIDDAGPNPPPGGRTPGGASVFIGENPIEAPGD